MPVGYGEFRVTQDAHVTRQIGWFAGLRGQEGGRFPASNQLIEESMDIAADPVAPAEREVVNSGRLQHMRAVVIIKSFLHDATVRIVVSPALDQL